VSKLLEIGTALGAQLKRPGAVASTAFLLVGAAIAANALFLQPRQHPAPLFATRGPADPEVEAGDALVRAVQEALAHSGRYAGVIDGIAGPQTEAAIRSFEEAAGRASTGESSVDLLAAILSARAAEIAASAPAEIAGGAPAEIAESRDPIAELARGEAAGDPLVASVQAALSVSAYGPLDADGVIGPETRAAIMRFERDHNLPVTGEISDGLVVELRATGAMHDG
jgi:peptidoglycan hydrolase-like protein with peptidoglycan-binding domain